jgi:ketosteroid isomerase-like protein
MPYNTSTEAERAFYAAFVNRDLEAMRSVWSPRPDAACIHPGGGLLLGIEAIMASWGEILTGASAPRVRVRPIQARTDGDTAYHLVEERIDNPSQQRRATVIATNVYQRSESGWLMSLHHASLPLVEPIDKPSESRAPLH